MAAKQWTKQYADILQAYHARPREELMYRASELGRTLLQTAVPPEDILTTHMECVERLCQTTENDPIQSLRSGTELLLELMMAYGIALRQQESLAKQLEARSKALETTVAELRKVQVTLQEREQKTQAIVQSATEGIITIDDRGIIDSFNEAAARMFGYSVEEVIGENVNMLMPARERKQHDGYIEDYLRTGHQKIIGIGREVEGRRKDGMSFPIYLAVSEVRLPSGRFFTGILHDITQEKQAEEIIRILAAFPQENPHPVLRANQEGVIVNANPAAIPLMNRWGLGIGCSLPEELQSSAQDVLKTGASREYEICVDESVFTFLLSPTEGGSSLYLYGRDVTAYKHADAALKDYAAALENANMALQQANQEAEDASLAKSNFLANISHEIRTPMTAILGFTESLFDSETSEEERRDAGHRIRRSSEHLLHVVNNILDISNLESGNVQTQRMECSLIELLVDVVSQMHACAVEKGLNLHVESPRALPEVIRTDPTRLRQILLNLLDNAIKFTHAGSVLLIVQLEREAGSKPSEGRMTFDVIDTGIGMTHEQSECVFQPYTQANETSSRRVEGLGLGLSISKRLARLLGGGLRVVDSKPDAGTHIRATVSIGPLEGVKMIEQPLEALCIAPEKANVEPIKGEKTNKADASTKKLSCRILLAEDGPDNQRLISHILRKAGAEVSLAENGRIAVDLALSEHFDLILMDMQMPELDGYEATRMLREAGHAGPIIALTANAGPDDRKRSLNAGCDEYLTKPIKRKKLIESISKSIQLAH